VKYRQSGLSIPQSARENFSYLALLRRAEPLFVLPSYHDPKHTFGTIGAEVTTGAKIPSQKRSLSKDDKRGDGYQKRKAGANGWAISKAVSKTTSQNF